MRSYGAIVSTGCEADDLLGIEQMSYNDASVEESMICSIDKDLRMIPGWHYHPGLRRRGSWIIEPHRYLVSPLDAMRFFYTQLLMGDATDGIKGVVGIGKSKADKLLAHTTTEDEMFNTVREAYSCDPEMLMNGQCLWIWRKENDIWQFPDGAQPEDIPSL